MQLTKNKQEPGEPEYKAPAKIQDRREEEAPPGLLHVPPQEPLAPPATGGEEQLTADFNAVPRVLNSVQRIVPDQLQPVVVGPRHLSGLA